MYEMNEEYPIIKYFEEHYRDLLKLALMMMENLDDAYDVLQDVAAVVIKRKDELCDVEDPGAYLAVCIRRRALNIIRNSRKSTAMSPEDIRNLCADWEAQAEMEQSEWMLWLEKYLQKCDPETRRAFILHYVDDIPIEKVAEQMGMKANTLTQKFKRMRQALARQSPRTMTHLMVLMLEV